MPRKLAAPPLKGRATCTAVTIKVSTLGDALHICCGRALAPGGGWDSEAALECPVEGSSRLVTHLRGNARKRHVAAAQVMSCQLEPPARQVMHRWLADHARETIGERRARKADIAPEVV